MLLVAVIASPGQPASDRRKDSDRGEGKRPRTRASTRAPTKSLTLTGKITKVKAHVKGVKRHQAQFVLKVGEEEYRLTGAHLPYLRRAWAESHEATFEVVGTPRESRSGKRSLEVRSHRLVTEKGAPKKAEQGEGEVVTEKDGEDKRKDDGGDADEAKE